MFQLSRLYYYSYYCFNLFCFGLFLHIFVCFFHFCQAILTNVRDYGLAKLYHSDLYFQLRIRMLFALAILPSESVIDTIEEIILDFNDDTLFLYMHILKILGYESYILMTLGVLHNFQFICGISMFNVQLWGLKLQI